jgi:hypothetical protein
MIAAKSLQPKLLINPGADNLKLLIKNTHDSWPDHGKCAGFPPLVTIPSLKCIPFHGYTTKKQALFKLRPA